MPPIKVKVDEKFKQLYTPPPGTDLIICIGGRGGKKTYEVSKFGAVSATIKNKRVAVLRDEKETIRESILNEIFTRFDTANKWGHFDGLYEKLQTGIQDKRTGDMLVFTKGFRASSNEKKTNLKGVSDVEIAIVEEAEDIRDFNKFSTFKDSIRTADRLIIVILNTPDIQHWIVKRYFHIEQIEIADIPEHLRWRLLKFYNTEKELSKQLDGYFKLIPKTIEGFHCIQSSYRDNTFLPAGVIRDYEAYGDPYSPTYDLHYFLTAILGFASAGRKGQVLRKVKPISLRDYLALPFKEIIGQDFGTSSPAGTVGVKMDGNNLYARQMNYLPLDALGIGKMYCKWGLGDNDLVIADSADAMAIGKLRRGFQINELNKDDIEKYPRLLKGFFIRGALKGPESITFGLNMLIGMNLFFVTESTDLWNETYNYVYAQNKSGEYTNDPIDEFNHLIDPIRYVAQSRGRYF